MHNIICTIQFQLVPTASTMVRGIGFLQRNSNKFSPVLLLYWASFWILNKNLSLKKNITWGNNRRFVLFNQEMVVAFLSYFCIDWHPKKGYVETYQNKVFTNKCNILMLIILMFESMDCIQMIELYSTSPPCVCSVHMHIIKTGKLKINNFCTFALTHSYNSQNIRQEDFIM